MRETMRGGSGDPGQEDAPEVQLIAFLKWWLDTHGEKFPEVEIYEYRPRRWTGKLVTFQELTGKFNIRTHTLLESVQFPKFPETRRFVPEEEEWSRPPPRVRFRPTIWSD
ncbi:hypothetical protein M408DRAFT_138851 [Serendipita vermifera MAFF 305830]|uniref:Uncharacterized protein n=1 Tax=Serendipita vermifera MAFF 305830 TaxID=933852 RepID=A0A0C2W1G9_SERVB|nr:hypothetical protein M408DRAFT_138851 [Serendipita vermifera MAFF 305830]